MACWISSRVMAVGLAALTFPALPESSASAQSLHLNSSAFAAGATIPAAYTCTGADQSPPLAWTGVPQNTQTIAVVVDDPDAPSGDWVHWVLYNLAARTPGLEAGTAKGITLENGARQGINDFGKAGYNGPCPPPGPTHHYHFRLFALNSALDLPAQATAAQAKAAIRSHVIASTELIGTFSR
jgi:Raf kinase inhibitor-like YbhB/YbcL family protein